MRLQFSNWNNKMFEEYFKECKNTYDLEHYLECEVQSIGKPETFDQKQRLYSWLNKLDSNYMANDSSEISLAIVEERKFNETAVRLLLNEIITETTSGIKDCEIEIGIEDPPSYPLSPYIYTAGSKLGYSFYHIQNSRRKFPQTFGK